MPPTGWTAAFCASLCFLLSPKIAFGDDPDDSGDDGTPGHTMNGPDFGIVVAFTRQGLTTLMDGKVAKVWIRDGVATLAGAERRGEEAYLFSAALSLTDEENDVVELAIDGLRWDPSNGLAVYDVWRRFYSKAGVAWMRPCTDRNGLPTYAAFLPGRWDPNTGQYASGGFTLACAQKAIVKCALAFTPWIPKLLDHSLACVRMMRADYCGNGKSHTRQDIGTPIAYTIEPLRAHPEWLFRPTCQPDSAFCDNDRDPGATKSRTVTVTPFHVPYYVFEAAWGREGAVCMGNGSYSDRVKRWVDLWDPAECELPSCSHSTRQGKLKSACLQTGTPDKCAPWYFVPSE